MGVFCPLFSRKHASGIRTEPAANVESANAVCERSINGLDFCIPGDTLADTDKIIAISIA